MPVSVASGTLYIIVSVMHGHTNIKNVTDLPQDRLSNERRPTEHTICSGSAGNEDELRHCYLDNSAFFFK